MSSLQPFASLAPSRQDNTYILSIVPVAGNGLAAITSAGETLLVDRENLSVSGVVRLDGLSGSLTCLTLGDALGQSIICSNSNGVVAIFDVRTQKKVSTFKLGTWLERKLCIH